jgi:choline-sulfatase
MTRREFTLFSLGALSAAARVSGKPNVLLLSVDDLNDWVGCLNGYPGVSTPNIDRLARRGVLFSDTHCASPLCNPSRTAMLTGLRPSTTGIYTNEQYWRPALPDVPTLPMWFRQNGYHAAGAGKVFHHVAGFNPPDQWDEFQLQEFDDPWYRRADFYPWNKRIPAPAGHPFNGLKDFPGEFDWGVLDRPEDQYGDQKAAAFAESFLRRKQQKPFFLAVGMWHPHIPLFSPQRFWDLYPESKLRLPETREDDLADVPEAGRRMAAARRKELERIVQEGKYREFIRAYLAAISFADALVGRVVDALEKSEHANNTVVVFWSDNGWHLGEKQHVHKSTLWQRSTHVPMIIAGPGIRPVNMARRQPVSLLDIYPTLVELCGLASNSRLEGTSLVPLLRDPNAKRAPAVSTFMPGNHAVVSTRWRYIMYGDGGEELYDRQADPNEYTNLAAEPKHAAVKRDLARFAPKTSAPMKPSRDQYDFDFTTHTYLPKTGE